MLSAPKNNPNQQVDMADVAKSGSLESTERSLSSATIERSISIDEDFATSKDAALSKTSNMADGLENEFSNNSGVVDTSNELSPERSKVTTVEHTTQTPSSSSGTNKETKQSEKYSSSSFNLMSVDSPIDGSTVVHSNTSINFVDNSSRTVEEALRRSEDTTQTPSSSSRTNKEAEQSGKSSSSSFNLMSAYSPIGVSTLAHSNTSGNFVDKSSRAVEEALRCTVDKMTKTSPQLLDNPADTSLKMGCFDILDNPVNNSFDFSSMVEVLKQSPGRVATQSKTPTSPREAFVFSSLPQNTSLSSFGDKHSPKPLGSVSASAVSSRPFGGNAQTLTHQFPNNQKNNFVFSPQHPNIFSKAQTFRGESITNFKLPSGHSLEASDDTGSLQTGYSSRTPYSSTSSGRSTELCKVPVSFSTASDDIVYSPARCSPPINHSPMDSDERYKFHNEHHSRALCSSGESWVENKSGYGQTLKATDDMSIVLLPMPHNSPINTGGNYNPGFTAHMWYNLLPCLPPYRVDVTSKYEHSPEASYNNASWHNLPLWFHQPSVDSTSKYEHFPETSYGNASYTGDSSRSPNYSRGFDISYMPNRERVYSPKEPDTVVSSYTEYIHKINHSSKNSGGSHEHPPNMPTSGSTFASQVDNSTKQSENWAESQSKNFPISLERRLNSFRKQRLRKIDPLVSNKKIPIPSDRGSFNEEISSGCVESPTIISSGSACVSHIDNFSKTSTNWAESQSKDLSSSIERPVYSYKKQRELRLRNRNRLNLEILPKAAERIIISPYNQSKKLEDTTNSWPAQNSNISHNRHVLADMFHVPELCLSKPHIPEVCLSEPYVPEICPSKPKNTEVCPSESPIPKVCPSESPIPEVCPSEWLIPEVCPSESLIPEVCPSESLIPEVCPSESLIPEVCPRESLIPEVCPRESLIPEVCPSESLIPEVCPRASHIPEVCPRESLIPEVFPRESHIPEVSSSEPHDPETRNWTESQSKDFPSCKERCVYSYKKQRELRQRNRNLLNPEALPKASEEIIISPFNQPKNSEDKTSTSPSANSNISLDKHAPAIDMFLVHEVCLSEPHVPEICSSEPKNPEACPSKSPISEVFLSEPHVPEICLSEPKNPEECPGQSHIPEVCPSQSPIPEVFLSEPHVPEICLSEPKNPEACPSQSPIPEVCPRESHIPEVCPRESLILEVFPRESHIPEVSSSEPHDPETRNWTESQSKDFPSCKERCVYSYKKQRELRQRNRNLLNPEALPKASEEIIISPFNQPKNSEDKTSTSPSANSNISLDKHAPAIDMFLVHEVCLSEPHVPEICSSEPKNPEACPSKSPIPEVFLSEPHVPEICLSEPKNPEECPGQSHIPEVCPSQSPIPEVFLSEPHVPEICLSEPKNPEACPSQSPIPEVCPSQSPIPEVCPRESHIPELCPRESLIPEVFPRESHIPEVSSSEPHDPETRNWTESQSKDFPSCIERCVYSYKKQRELRQRNRNLLNPETLPKASEEIIISPFNQPKNSEDKTSTSPTANSNISHDKHAPAIDMFHVHEVCLSEPHFPEICSSEPKNPEACPSQPHILEACPSKAPIPEVFLSEPHVPEICLSEPKNPEACPCQSHIPEVCLSQSPIPEIFLSEPHIPEICLARRIQNL